MVKSWSLGNGITLAKLPLGRASLMVAENRNLLPPCFSLASSFCMAEIDVPLETFMNPKNVLLSEVGLRASISHAAPQRLMARGAFAGSDPITSWNSFEGGSSGEMARRM